MVAYVDEKVKNYQRYHGRSLHANDALAVLYSRETSDYRCESCGNTAIGVADLQYEIWHHHQTICP